MKNEIMIVLITTSVMAPIFFIFDRFFLNAPHGSFLFCTLITALGAAVGILISKYVLRKKTSADETCEHVWDGVLLKRPYAGNLGLCKKCGVECYIIGLNNQ